MAHLRTLLGAPILAPISLPLLAVLIAIILVLLCVVVRSVVTTLQKTRDNHFKSSCQSLVASSRSQLES